MDIQKINHLQIEYVALAKVRESINTTMLTILGKIEEEEKKP